MEWLSTRACRPGAYCQHMNLVAGNPYLPNCLPLNTNCFSSQSKPTSHLLRPISPFCSFIIVTLVFPTKKGVSLSPLPGEILDVQRDPFCRWQHHHLMPSIQGNFYCTGSSKSHIGARNQCCLDGSSPGFCKNKAKV